MLHSSVCYNSRMEDCIFCKIVKKEAPAHVVWEDQAHIAFLTIFPNTDGFTVVIPKEHKPSYIFENDDATITALMLATKKVALLLDAAFEDVGRTGMFFEGFGVDHLHSKLSPMHGTGDMEKWAPIDSDMKDVFFEKYPGYLSSHNAGKATDEKLAEIANKIKEAAQKQ